MKQHITDLAQKPLAPTSTAKRCTLQPPDSMDVFSGRYLLNFSSCHFSMFSLHGQVNLIRITFLVELENMTIPGCIWVKIMWGGEEYWSCRSVNSFQFNTWYKMPTWGDFLRGALEPFLTNLIRCFGFGGTDSILLINLFRAAKIWDNTFSWEEHYIPLKCVRLCKWFCCTENRRLKRRFSRVWGFLVMVKYQKLKRDKTTSGWSVMQAKTSMRNPVGCNSTTLPTVPGVELELPLKC